jgi:hypothetical protein
MKKSVIAAGVLLLGIEASWLPAQTLIDLRSQSKDVDFSAAVSTRPMQTGAILPARCVIGRTFYKSNAAPGANLYGCTALNTWTPESQSPAMANQLGDFAVARTDAHTLTIGAQCSPPTPCSVRFGNLTDSLMSSGVASISGGTGLALI